jgi:hypothetical protein
MIDERLSVGLRVRCACGSFDELLRAMGTTEHKQASGQHKVMVSEQTARVVKEPRCVESSSLTVRKVQAVVTARCEPRRWCD